LTEIEIEISFFQTGNEIWNGWSIGIEGLHDDQMKDGGKKNMTVRGKIGIPVSGQTD